MRTGISLTLESFDHVIMICLLFIHLFYVYQKSMDQVVEEDRLLHVLLDYSL